MNLHIRGKLLFPSGLVPDLFPANTLCAGVEWKLPWKHRGRLEFNYMI